MPSLQIYYWYESETSFCLLNALALLIVHGHCMVHVIMSCEQMHRGNQRHSLEKDNRSFLVITTCMHATQVKEIQHMRSGTMFRTARNPAPGPWVATDLLLTCHFSC